MNNLSKRTLPFPVTSNHLQTQMSIRDISITPYGINFSSALSTHITCRQIKIPLPSIYFHLYEQYIFTHPVWMSFVITSNPSEVTFSPTWLKWCYLVGRAQCKSCNWPSQCPSPLGSFIGRVSFIMFFFVFPFSWKIKLKCRTNILGKIRISIIWLLFYLLKLMVFLIFWWAATQY